MVAFLTWARGGMRFRQLFRANNEVFILGCWYGLDTVIAHLITFSLSSSTKLDGTKHSGGKTPSGCST
jgi:hypothetical protein